MVTIYDINRHDENKDGEVIMAEIRGLSTDEKPKKIGDAQVGNGSAFIEIDTQKVFLYNAEGKKWEGE